MNENNQIEQKLACSLTAETTDLLPFLPYLLQDIWELGSSPQEMGRLIQQHIMNYDQKILIDLGCGKGAVSVWLCKELGIKAKGIDLLPDFIEIARTKAKEYGVESLCSFIVQDINESVKTEHGYDIAILGAVGDVLGDPEETLQKLKAVIKNGGYLLIDEAYLLGDADDVRYQNYEYLTLEQWTALFAKLELELVAEKQALSTAEMDTINDYNNQMIRKRAEELIQQYPKKRKIFEGYVKSQEMECEDLDDVLVGVTWLLRKAK